MELTERIVVAKKSSDEKNEFIKDYIPYIKAVVSQVCLNNDVENMDEYSIALLAFSSCIDLFEVNKGNFLTFVKNQIKWRIYDYWKKEKLNCLSIDDEENNQMLVLCNKQSVAKFNEFERSNALKLELEHYKDRLFECGIEFSELVDIKPKHLTLKLKCKKLIETILNSQEMQVEIITNNRLPAKRLSELTGISIKTIDKLRKYLIAIVLATSGDYEYVAQYAMIWR